MCKEDKRIKKNKEHVKFFNELLEKTENAFRQSDILNNYKSKNWGYSITATRFEKNKPLIVGFNWGAGEKWEEKNKTETIQKSYPLSSFSSLDADELGSFIKVVSLFTKYLPEANSGIQTNFCFFRSQYEYQISANDRERCTPLFEELIKYLEPTMLLSFSRYLDKYFTQTNRIIDKQTAKIKSNNRIIYASKGSVKINNDKINYFNLPHPNYQITTEARLKAWDYCFKGNH